MPDQTNWTGSVWGATTKGNVAAEIVRQGNRIGGKIALFEPGLGQLQALLSGEWSDANKITATLHQFTGNYSVAVALPQTGKMDRSEEHTSELQSLTNLVCRLLLG